MQEYKKVFIKYAFPTVMGMLVTTLYTFVDGIFVGNYVGSNAIAAIGIVWPFLSMAIAFSVLIATGGGALTSINFGRGNKERAQNLFSQSMTIAVSVLALFSVICILFPKQISLMLGANDVLINDCSVYIRAFMFFGVFFGMTVVLNTFVNNDKNPKLALAGMISGCITNIFLDYLFVYVFKWGLWGAAVASGLGQVVACLTLYLHFFLKKGELKFEFQRVIIKDAKKIIITGVPSLVNEISVPLGAVFYNYVIIRRMGETGVAVFAVVAYLLTIYFCVFSGVAQGMQPPISRYYGKKQPDMVKKLFTSGIYCAIALSIGLYVLMFAFTKEAVSMFTKDALLIKMSIPALRIYGLFCIFYAVNMVIISLFQATRNTLPATVISTSKCFFFNIIYVLILPHIFGNTGIWLAASVGEASVFLFALLQYRLNSNKIFGI